ncbi:fatty acid desaturase, partial [Agrococcus casei]
MTSPTTTLSGLGPVRQTYARTEDFPKTPRAFALVSQEVRSAGLLARAYWFYGIVAAALVLAFAGSVTGMILLGGSWFQLLIAGAAGILFTQVAFLTHEAAHRQILKTGPANDLLARILAAGVVGISYAWWDSKHTRHHSNP